PHFVKTNERKDRKTILFIRNLHFLHMRKHSCTGLATDQFAGSGKPFPSKNFLLLAAKYRINEADAAIIQAKLYPNPNFYLNQGLYNAETKKWLDFSETGETAL